MDRNYCHIAASCCRLYTLHAGQEGMLTSARLIAVDWEGLIGESEGLAAQLGGWCFWSFPMV
eukprot:1741720-Amphidinium_carterae.1